MDRFDFMSKKESVWSFACVQQGRLGDEGSSFLRHFFCWHEWEIDGADGFFTRAGIPWMDGWMLVSRSLGTWLFGFGSFVALDAASRGVVVRAKEGGSCRILAGGRRIMLPN